MIFKKSPFLNTVLLELRKQRNTFAGLILCCFLGLAAGVVILELGSFGLTLQESLIGAGGLLSLITPLLAVVLGTSAAASAREEIDFLLPVSPFKKAAASWLASALYFLLAAGFCLQWLGLASVFEVLWAWVDQTLSYLPWIFGQLIYLHLLAFVIAYWIRRSFLAGGLALILGFLEAQIFRAAILLVHISPVRTWNIDEVVSEYHFEPPFTLTILISCALLLIAMWLVAPRQRNHTLRWRHIPIAFLSATGILCAVVTFQFTLDKAFKPVRSLRPLNMHKTRYFEKGLDHEGAVFYSLMADLVFVTSTGQSKVIRAGRNLAWYNVLPHTVWESEMREFLITNCVISNVVIDAQGSCWVLYRPDDYHYPDRFELAVVDRQGRGSTTKIEKPSQGHPYLNLRIHNNHAVLQVGDGRQQNSLAALAEGRPIRWEKYDRPINFQYAEETERIAAEIDRGEIAVVSSDKRFLVQSIHAVEVQRWQLPGPARTRYDSLVPALNSGEHGGLIFAVPVQDESNVQLLLCHPDGSISAVRDAVWKEELGQGEISIEHVPLKGAEAQAWFSSFGTGPLILILKTSELFIEPPLNLNPFLNAAGYRLVDKYGTLFWNKEMRVSPVRYSEGRLWLMVGDSMLFQVEMKSGRILSSTRLDDETTAAGQSSNRILFYAFPTKDGLYYRKNQSLYIVDWQGSIRKLRSAS